jgi:elongation of very long chain fatty acids protein 7
MAQLVQMVYDGYRDLMDNKSDPRVNDWPMMSGPFPTLTICLFYAYFAKILGPKLMANRKPFDLRRVMLWYNIFQVIFSIWMFNEVSCLRNLYSFRRNSSRYFILFLVCRLSRAGEDDTPLGVNRWITQTVRMHCAWHEVAGGIICQSSSSS